MKQKITTFILSVLCVKCFCHVDRKIGTSSRIHDDLGSILFLTPYIESGKIVEGRRLARVEIPDMPDIDSYAGFFTVDKSYNSNHFLWYFPAMSNNKLAPVILWLQGGPGGTSLYGLFDENGPIRVEKDKMVRRRFHWAIDHHLIYIDNPVGTGFSFTNDSHGYCTNQEQIGEQLYSTLSQFFQLFPELQTNNFIVSGESYAGKYVPALAYTIHKKNPFAKTKINIKGLAIGNGLCDPVNQLFRISPYLYQIGLIDWNLAEVIDRAEKQILGLIYQQKWVEAQELSHDLLLRINKTTGLISRYNYLQSTDKSVDNIDFGPLLENSSVRKVLHVGDLKFSNGSVVKDYLKADLMKSVTPWISELLDHYKVLIYNGQLDMAVAYPWTVNFLRKLNFSSSEEYKTAVRYKWMYGNKLAGFLKQAGNLTEVLVRDAGHMVPKDQPVWALNLITWFADGAVFDLTMTTNNMNKLKLQK